MENKQPQPKTLELCLQEQLDARWVGWFDDLTITLTDDGNTILCGEVKDQAALHGLFKKVSNLGLTIISANLHSH